MERTDGTTEREILGGLLFRGDMLSEAKDMLEDQWKEREVLIALSDLGAG